MSAGVQPSDYAVPEEVKAAGFGICGEELGPIVEGPDLKKLNSEYSWRSSRYCRKALHFNQQWAYC